MSILRELKIPAGWPQVRLDGLFQRSYEANASDLQPLSVFTDYGVVPRASRDHSYKALGADLEKNLRVRPGDLVFNKLRTWQGAIGISAYDGIVSPAYFVLRARGPLDVRFYHHLLRSSAWVQELKRVSKYMPPNQNDISWDDLRQILVPVPPLSTQIAIAHYLDAETARFDTLIDKRQRMTDLLDERASSMTTDLIWSGTSWTSVRLKHVAGVPTSGNRDHSNFTFDEEGVKCLRGLNVKPNRLELDGVMRISAADHHSLSETALYEGDIVIVRSGLAGSAVAIPSGIGPCNCVDLVVVRRCANLDPMYLQFVINSAKIQEHVRARRAGAILNHFNAVDAGDIEVPLRPLEDQIRIGSQVASVMEKTQLIIGTLESQVRLLVERRQALITAAVTGQLEIPEVAV